MGLLNSKKLEKLNFYKKSDQRGNNLKFTLVGKEAVKVFINKFLPICCVELREGIDGKGNKVDMIVYKGNYETQFNGIYFCMMEGDYIIAE